MTWKRSEPGESTLKCTGKHELNCEYTFTVGYDTEGDFSCKGFNFGRNSNPNEDLVSVNLSTSRSSDINI